MKQLLLTITSAVFLAFTSSAQVCNLFFSEYLEGASNNKAVEFYNPLNVTVNLTDYVIYRYNNGSTTPTDSLFPQGTLAPGAVFVAGNPSAIAAILAVSDTLHTITFFNGDDAMELRYRPTQTTLDVIGIRGNDPGTNWPVGAGATSEFTLVRMFPHTDGELDWSISVNEWDVYPVNTTTFIGSHSGAPCCLANSSSLSVSACSSYSWAENGQIYTASGSYNDTLTNIAGCDSIITLNLTINLPSSSSLTESACSSFIWLENGQTYTTSGSYNDTLTNIIGCDSIITLNLTINLPTTSSVTASACSSFIWLENGMTYTTSGSYNDTISNVSGCDSIITLNLTINLPSSSSSTITECDSYTWNTNGMIYTASGTYMDTLSTVSGCDSIVTLNLTIVPTPTANATFDGLGTLTGTGGSTFQWINCTTNAAIAGATSATYTPPVNGTYAVVVSDGSCSDTSDCVVVNVIGLNENPVINATIFPNPFQQEVTVRAKSMIQTLVVSDLSGKVLLTQAADSNEWKLDLSSYSNGVYMVLIQTQSGTETHRIVKK